MKLLIEQEILTWRDKFTVMDDCGNPRYYVKGDLFSWGKKLHVTDLSGREVAYVEQQLFTFLPRYAVYAGGVLIGEVVKEFTFFRPKYTVNGPDWVVDGNFWEHEYCINTNAGAPVATVSKEYFTWADTYRLQIFPGGDEIGVLATVLAIDACIEANQRNGG